MVEDREIFPRHFATLQGNPYFTQLDLALGFLQAPVAEADRQKTGLRDSRGRLFAFIRAGIDPNVLPAAFTRMVKSSLGNPNLDVVSRLDDILSLRYA